MVKKSLEITPGIEPLYGTRDENLRLLEDGLHVTIDLRSDAIHVTGTPEAVERREWLADPLVYRLFQDFLRGGFEGGLQPTSRLHLLDARRIAVVSESAVKTALSSGSSVIVGRGSQYFLRDRKDVFHVFLYASRDYKIHRLIARGASQDKAIEQVDTTDKARAEFVRQYLGLKWPEPELFHAMFNTGIGESCTDRKSVV